MLDKPATTVAASLLLITVAFVGCLGDDEPPGDDDEEDPGVGEPPELAVASLVDTEGSAIGNVSFGQLEDDVAVVAELDGLEAGFHGFHLHETGACEPAFTDAGGHHAPDDEDHGDHAGDMPVLLVTEDGRAQASFTTDRATMSGLFDEDGTAVIVHALPDNYANIPDRYGGPDEDTLATGDAGGRVACGAIEESTAEAELAPSSADAQATLVDPDGEDAGTVSFTGLDGVVRVTAEVTGVSTGFHGFHLHETGACQPAFALAGGHYAPGDGEHGDHAGDMPVLLVTENGTADLQFATDRFAIGDLTDLDGTAVVVHALPDNYANIPDRYDGPDEDSRSTGDAGERVACGAVEDA